MNKETLHLKSIGEAVLKLLKEEFGLQPKVLSVGILLARDDFNVLAEDHPDAVLPRLLQAFERTDDRRLLWSVQIQPETTIEDFPPDMQERLRSPP